MTQAITDYLVELYNVLPEVDLPEFNLGTLGLILVTAGIVAGAFQYIRGWDKRKGFRMVLKDRNDKKHAMWLEIIQEGVDKMLATNRVSNKEANEMFAEAAAKMKLYDLIPKQRLQSITKERIKRERALRGVSPTIPVKKRFSEQLGKAASKFWRKKSA